MSLKIIIPVLFALIISPLPVFAEPSPMIMDIEPPIILIPMDIYVISKTPTAVPFSVKALDNFDGKVPVNCDMISMGVFKMGKTTVRCEAYDKTGNRNQASFLVTVGYEVVQIPTWVKNATELWVDDRIDDATYSKTISYLIQQKIVKVPTVKISDNPMMDIPVWIKTNAGYWVDEKISDDEYSIMLQWMINRGVIKI